MNHTLLSHHLQEAMKRGVSEDTCRAAGIHSETDRQVIAGILNRKRYGKAGGPVIVFPYTDRSGAVVLNRVRPDNPPKGGNGKPAGKYLSPTGAPVRVYFPPRVFAALDDPGREVVITEGEFKALAGWQNELPTIGLAGVDCWHARNSTALLPDLEQIHWQGRKVYICFDSDLADNPAVRENESLLAAALKLRGATVRVVRLPSEENGDKNGLDDFIVRHGTGELRKLLDAAEEPDPPDPESTKVPAGLIDAAREAERMLETVTVDGVPTLRYWRGVFCRWTHGAYREVSAEEAKANVVKVLNAHVSRLSCGKLSDVMMQLRAQSHLPDTVDAPRWLSGPSPWPAGEVLVARNGLFHLPAIVDGKTPWCCEPTPRFFATSALDYDLTLDAPEPVEWLAFLQSLWPDAPSSIATLQEWFGYCLATDTSQHKMLFLVGPRRSGKGTIARVLRGLVGPKNVAGPALSDLGGPFGLWSLLDKSVAIVADARLSGRSDRALVVERLLEVSGEDAVDVHRKMMEPVRSVRLGARLVLMSNELPRLSDTSGALASRLVCLRLTRSWLGHEDTALSEKLLAELPGVLLWAIGGWGRLRERGRFLQPESGRGIADQLEELGSPVGAFVNECCELAPDTSTPRAELFEEYRAWCKQNGRDHVTDAAGFGRDLRTVLPDLRDAQPRIDGRQVRCYVGIRVRPDW